MSGAAAEAGKQIGGRYVLESLLGRGGMGEVWQARHLALNATVAIKFLEGASAHRESARKRFLMEAQLTARLKTRHAVQVFDFGVTEEGQAYLVMELLDGETLGHRIATAGRLPAFQVVHLMAQAARALDRAHTLGIVHRDFKPDNIVIGGDVDATNGEVVRVLDFGIAKLLGELSSPADFSESAASLADLSSVSMRLSRTQSFLGTPVYMAPEQIEIRPDLDLRADIWAFGVVVFECLTGEVPFRGENLVELFQNIRRGSHPAARALVPTLPPRFDVWFDRACSVRPADRFASARRAATALGEALAGADSGPILVRTQSGENPSAPALAARDAALSGEDTSDSTDQAVPRLGLQDTVAAGANHAAGTKHAERILTRSRTNGRLRTLTSISSVVPPPLSATGATSASGARRMHQHKWWLAAGALGLALATAIAWRFGATRNLAPRTTSTAPSTPPRASIPDVGPVVSVAQTGPSASLTESARASASPAPSATAIPSQVPSTRRPLATPRASVAAASAAVSLSPEPPATSAPATPTPTKRGLGEVDRSDPFAR